MKRTKRMSRPFYLTLNVSNEVNFAQNIFQFLSRSNCQYDRGWNSLLEFFFRYKDEWAFRSRRDFELYQEYFFFWMTNNVNGSFLYLIIYLKIFLMH